MLVIVLVFVGEMAGLTPPIGMNVFATASALRVDPGKIFKGVTPFFLMEFATALSHRGSPGDRDVHSGPVFPSVLGNTAGPWGACRVERKGRVQ